MNEEKVCRVWLYARIPGDYVGTMNSIKVCAIQAEADGCEIVGSSTDLRSGWLLRPGYREMLRRVRMGEIDAVYFCRMRHISRRERHLFSFFRQLMKYEVKAAATEYDIAYRVSNFKLGRKIEAYAAKHGMTSPYLRRGTVPQEQYQQARHFAVMTANRPLVRGDESPKTP